LTVFREIYIFLYSYNIKNTYNKIIHIIKIMTTLNIAKQIHTVYLPTNGFPEWVLNQELWSEFEFDKTVVYYHKEDDLEKVKQMVKEREPCNINMRRIYFGEFKAAPLRGADLNSISDARISEADSESNETNLDSNSSTGSACNSLRVAALESPINSYKILFI